MLVTSPLRIVLRQKVGDIIKKQILMCREGCGACCIAPSISTPIPGMLKGKPAGRACVQLDSENRCLLFGDTQRPQVCKDFQPSFEVCGESRIQAIAVLTHLEEMTRF